MINNRPLSTVEMGIVDIRAPYCTRIVQASEEKPCREGIFDLETLNQRMTHAKLEDFNYNNLSGLVGGHLDNDLITCIFLN